MNRNRVFCRGSIVVILSLAAGVAGAQTPGEDQRTMISSVAAIPATAPTQVLAGDLRTELFGFRTLERAPFADETGGKQVQNLKSPLLAGALSLALPGAGEFYAGNYVRSAIFFAAEIVLWGLAYHYDNKGNRGTDDFNNYADTHWNIVRYVQYTLNNLVPKGSTYAVWTTGSAPASNVANPWNYVNWSEMNRMERDVAATSTGSFYSHTLPVHGDQQYYEEVGKYEQYNSGWDDVSQSLPPDYATIRANESANGQAYMSQRASVNGYYKNASTFVAVALLNHLLSTIDAVLAANSYNRSIHAEVGMQTVPTGTTVTSLPVLKVSVAF
jgi:hypothetical protein